MDGRTKLHRFRYQLGSGFVTPSTTVLDLGCGTGYGSAILAEKAMEVRGFDMEQANIDTCNRVNKAFNTIYECANLEEIEIPEADVACSFEVIEHLYNPEAFVNKVKKAIKQYICVSVPIGEHLHKDRQDVVGDSTHHSVFPSPAHFDKLFIDDDWDRFYGFQSGVTYIAVYYNRKAMEDE